MFKKYHIDFPLDDPRATLAHRDIILKKRFLKLLYLRWYKQMMGLLRIKPAESYLEIGSGGGFLKEIFPDVITSDILPLPGVDQTFSAEKMPFENRQLSGIMMLNVFHHIPKPYLFLSEAQRCLKHGGRVVMTEPANSALGRFIYKRFHHEPFDESAGREIDAGHPLSNSNQALPYIYFERDTGRFSQEFPHLKIVSVKYHSPFSYIISGGVSRSAMLPAFCFHLVIALEWLLQPFSKTTGLFCTVVLEKRDGE